MKKNKTFHKKKNSCRVCMLCDSYGRINRKIGMADGISVRLLL